MPDIALIVFSSNEPSGRIIEIVGLSPRLGISVLSESSRTTTVVLVTLLSKPPRLTPALSLSDISITSPHRTNAPAAAVVIKEQVTNKEYSNQPKEVRLLAYKFLVDSFNSKYSSLSESQQLILKNYIENIDNSGKLRKFIVSEVARLKRELKSIKLKS